MGITALLHTGYKYDTYTDRWKKNPYIMSRIPLLPRDTQLAVRLETDIELLQNMKLNLGVEREWIDLYQYWERNSNRGYIDLKTIEDVVLTEVKAGITLDINNWTRLETAFIGYSDKLETNNLVENMNQIPYRPQFRIPIRLNLQLLKDMHFTTIANILGERSTSLGGEKSLPAFGLLRASINKEFGHITAVLSVNNLLDSDYTIWEKYPENGITVLGGLIAKF
jgi:hypothetical protein